MRLIAFLITLVVIFIGILFYLNPDPVSFRYFFGKEIKVSLPLLLTSAFGAGVVFFLLLYTIRNGGKWLRTFIYERKKRREAIVVEKVSTLIEEGNYEKAITLLKEVSSPERTFLEAKALCNERRYSEAFSILKENLDLKNLRLVNLAMEAGMACGEWDEVRKIGEKAVDFHKDAPIIWKRMANVYERLGDFDSAIDALSRYVKKYGKEDDRIYLSYLYYMKGKATLDTKEAIRAFKHSLDEKPCFSPSLVALVEVYSENGNPEKFLKEARECFQTSNSYFVMKQVPLSLIKKGDPLLALEFVADYEGDEGKTFIFLSILYELGMREEYNRVLNSLPEEFRDREVFKLLSQGYSPDKVEGMLSLWLCKQCGVRVEGYSVRCPFCGGIDTLNLSLR